MDREYKILIVDDINEEFEPIIGQDLLNQEFYLCFYLF